MTFLYNALVFTFSAMISFLMIREILRIAYKRKLFDYIDGRKVHKKQVPRLGGIAFAPGIILSISLLMVVAMLTDRTGTFIMDDRCIVLALVAILLIYCEGMADDLLGLSYKTKFICQFICAIMLVLAGVHFTTLYGLLGVDVLPAAVSYPLSVVFIVGVINAINLIDGIDGLASGLSMITLFCFGIVFSLYGETALSVVTFATLGVIVPFFYYNVFGSTEARQKIFMGDCGSQTIGLIVGVLAVRLCMLDNAEATLHLPNTLVVVFGLLLVPSFDVVRVMVGRMRRGRSPFHADQTHIHHKLLALGLIHRQAMVTILLIAVGFAALTLALSLLLNINFVILADIIVWSAMHLYLNRLMRQRDRLDCFPKD